MAPGLCSNFLKRGGLWVAAQFLLLGAILLLGMWVRREPRPLALVVCGWALLMASAGCAIAGAVALGRNLTPFPKPSAGAQFIQHGIYRHIRHPLYTSVIAAAVGWSLIRSSWPALAASIVLALLLNAKASREEQWLRQQFKEYAGYQARVRRFLPGLY